MDVAFYGVQSNYIEVDDCPCLKDIESSGNKCWKKERQAGANSLLA